MNEVANDDLVPARPAWRIALVAPRNMRFSSQAATSIDLHIRETALWSRYRDHITVFAEEVDLPFDDVPTRFWPMGRQKGNLERLLAAERPDLIVAHQHLPTAARLAGRFRRVPVALVRHNFQSPPRSFLSALVKRHWLNRLAAIAFVSERCRDNFVENWPGIRPPVYVTPNGVDSRLWCSDAVKERVIMFCGRLAPEKGVMEAARGIGAVLAERPDWRGIFVLAVSPDHEAYAGEVLAVLDALGDRVEVVTDATHDAVRDRMARAAIAVAPTQGEESFGRVAVEAMASGAAVVLSQASGFVEVVGEAGVLLDRPDAEHVRRAVLALIDDDARRLALSRAARARVENRYDLSRSVMSFDRMVEHLLNRHARPAMLDAGVPSG